MMKSKLIIGLILCTVVLQGQVYTEMAMDTSMTFEEIVEEAEEYFETQGRGQHTGYKAFKRWEYRMKRCLDDGGRMIYGPRAQAAYDEYLSITPVDDVLPASKRLWDELGPYETSNTTGWSSHLGRITSVSVDPSDPSHILVGSPTGGVWKTTDRAQTWTPIFDFETNTDVYSLTICPQTPSRYLVGTWGGGLYKTEDAGVTWTKAIGVPDQTRIIEIKMDPANPDIGFAINEGGNIYRTTDGGESWVNRYISHSTLYDLEFSPDGSGRVYASGANAVVRSLDQGVTWETIGHWRQNRTLINPIMMAVTPAAPDYLYVLEAQNGGFHSVHLSVDGGRSFTLMSDDSEGNGNILGYDLNTKGGQSPRDMDIVVSPHDPFEVHVGGIMTHRSQDSGQTWQQMTHWLVSDPLPFIHADLDMMQYTDHGIYFATDGGLFFSDDKGDSYTDLSSGLNIRQFYRIDVADDHTIAAGSQDNGMSKYTESGGWLDITGADGMEPLIDKDDSGIIYSSIQYGNIYKTVDGGWTLSGLIVQSPGRGDWVTPLEQDPVKPNTLYQGKRQLYKSQDAGWSWEPISRFVMNNPIDTFMQEVEVASQDGDYIICGFEEQLFKTENGGRSWTDISPPNAFSNVNYISIHPADKNWIAIALSGVKNRLMQSTDGGQTWFSIFDGLPDLGVECVVYEGGPLNGMYVGMDRGVYYRNSALPEWLSISENIPNVAVTEVEVKDCSLYACTFGRGLWMTEIFDDSQVYLDNDNDGVGDSDTGVSYCLGVKGYVSEPGDCDDDNPDVSTSGTMIVAYEDLDGDGVGGQSISYDSCEGEPAGLVESGGDCDDADATTNPSARELCDGIDNNCDGVVDEGCESDLPLCDGSYLFILDFFREEYHATERLRTDATLPEGWEVKIGAGIEIDLYPEFEVPLGTSFSASITPCNENAGGRSETMINGAMLETDLKLLFSKKSSVRIQVIDEAGHQQFDAMVSLDEFFRSEFISELEAGSYTLLASSGDRQAHKQLVVVR